MFYVSFILILKKTFKERLYEVQFPPSGNHLWSSVSKPAPAQLSNTKPSAGTLLGAPHSLSPLLPAQQTSAEQLWVIKSTASPALSERESQIPPNQARPFLPHFNEFLLDAQPVFLQLSILTQTTNVKHPLLFTHSYVSSIVLSQLLFEDLL